MQMLLLDLFATVEWAGPMAANSSFELINKKSRQIVSNCRSESAGFVHSTCSTCYKNTPDEAVDDGNYSSVIDAISSG
jgi:hypothetical protein